MTYLIKKENIETNVNVTNWQEAITYVGKLLVNSKSIQETYITQMIDAVNTLGPYIVISKGFALAHSAPDTSVQQSDVSLITLEKPISFGSSNDPVKVVMCLACTDAASHVSKLKKIAEILMQEGMIDKIYETKSIDEIYGYFKEVD